MSKKQQNAGRSVHVVIETTRKCPWTDTCGLVCPINMREHARNARGEMPLAKLEQAFDELLASSESVYSLALVGKEILADMERLRAVTSMYHHAPLRTKPLLSGVTSGLGLKSRAFIRQHAQFLKLNTLTVSLDVFGNGLRNPGENRELLAGAQNFREAGGAQKLAVATGFSPTSVEASFNLGIEVCRSEIDQWNIHTLNMQNPNGYLVSSVAVAVVEKLFARLYHEIDRFSGKPVILEVDPDTFAQMINYDPFEHDFNIVHEEIPGRLYVVTTNVLPGRLLRLFADGGIGDVFNIANVRSPYTYRTYRKNKLKGLLQQKFPRLRKGGKERRTSFGIH